MPLTITPVEGPFRIETKRFNIPFDVTSTCPKCSEVVSKYMCDVDYLSYPTVGEPINLGFYCDECGSQWSEKIVLGITVTPV